jgi:RNA polymerase sigma-70 factor (ECF subfamily)
LNERDLLDRLRRGDDQAFDAIFRSHYGALVGIATRILGERAAAEEVAQDVLLELWRRRETLAIEATLRAYLFRATRNRALNLIRHERVARRFEAEASKDVAHAQAADQRTAENEINAAIADAMTALPDRCREVFELSRMHGLTYAEIARTMGISVKTVEAQMGKALRIMRERLARWLPG